MVERFPPALRRLDEDLELARDLLLVDEVGKAFRAKRRIELVLAAGQLAGGQSFRLGLAERVGGGDARVPRDAHERAPVPWAARRSAALMNSSALEPSAP